MTIHFTKTFLASVSHLQSGANVTKRLLRALFNKGNVFVIVPDLQKVPSGFAENYYYCYCFYYYYHYPDCDEYHSNELLDVHNP